MENLIELHAVGKRYGPIDALRNITVAVPPGQVIGLLGHNGAGKSTLIKLVLGLIRASDGELRVLGQAPWGAHVGALRRQIGYLPESVAFYRNLTGNEIIDYFAKLKRAPAEQARDLLRRVGLQGAADRKVGMYSKGMRQRLGLAQALLGSPRLVILDEPTTGLDPQATRDLYAIVDELRSAGRGVLISSHLLAELEPHIDGAVILREGELLASGSIGELRRKAGLPSVARARLKDGADRSAFVSRLAAAQLQPRSEPDGLISIPMTHERKIELIRDLVASPSVVDLEVEEPDLGRLYEWLGAGRLPGAGRLQ